MRGKMEWQREISGFAKGEGWSASMEKGKGGLRLVYKRYEEKKVYFLRFPSGSFFCPYLKFPPSLRFSSLFIDKNIIFFFKCLVKHLYLIIFFKNEQYQR
jgi:hypothetical protein